MSHHIRLIHGLSLLTFVAACGRCGRSPDRAAAARAIDADRRSPKLSSKHILLSIVAACCWALPAGAEDTYFVKSVTELDVTDGTLPDFVGRNYSFWNRPIFPYATIDGEGEVYVASPDNTDFRLAVKAASGKQVTGRLFLPSADDRPARSVSFSILAADGDDNDRNEFLKTKLDYYQGLLRQDLPGAAWFRHQVRETELALGKKPAQAGGARRNFVWRRSNEMVDTYALFSGGRAVSENLQLDRLMPAGQAGQANVALESLTGVTVREFDWKPLVKDLKPATDPLAKLIPFDQHAIFFSSFAALMQVADHAAEQGTPVLRAAEPRAVDARSRARYERQLCLPTSAIARLLGPQLVASIAMTGGDPYLRTGSDVAVLFEAKNKNVKALRLAIDARVSQAGRQYETAKAVQGQIAGVYYSGMRSPDRVICSYVATLSNAVVVTNSPAQLDELIRVDQQKKPSLAALDEYTFFRDRYRRDDPEEMALLILSDATIRRWCNPKWRIATSRRTRAAALMAEAQAANFKQLVAGKVAPAELQIRHAAPDGDSYLMTPAGVQSSIHGTLAFHTPIIEQDITHVTAQEAQFYQRWRDGYQRNWSNFFDPIAVRFHLSDKKMAADVTVMPLIDNSQYNLISDLSRGAKIQAGGGDPHKDTLVHLAMSLNANSPTLKQYSNMMTLFAPQIQVSPLSWLGETVAVYVDADSYWTDLAKAEDPDDFIEQNTHRLPVALHVQVTSVLKLTAFLAAMRAYIEQTAPGMTVWEALDYEGQPYVRIGPSQQAQGLVGSDKIRIYYAASADGLLMTLSEAVLKRALDRRKARREAVAAGKPVPRAGQPWLGENLCMQVDEQLIRIVEFAAAQEKRYQKAMQDLAWGNVAVLNEWRRTFPDEDPVKLHERFWHRRLVCPGGGEYRWNDEWQTMESSTYGHPGVPKSGPALPVALQKIARANFGVSFEKHGLRARAELFPKPADATEVKAEKE